MTIQRTLQYAILNWNLESITSIYENDQKAVYQAHSAVWGPVILKLNLRREELDSEYGMLQRMDGHACCQAYAYDGERGILIEERILPGTVLRQLENAQERAEHFLTVFCEIHREMGEGGGFDTYLDWLKRADDYCRAHSVNPKLAGQMHRALKIGEELFEVYSDRVLLHGDLHHDNLLLNSTGEYTAIDPKGVVGPAVFDLPRYLLNELGYMGHEDPQRVKERLEWVISFLCDRLDCPKPHVKKLFFMETILENVWSAEDGIEPDWREVEAATEIID